MIEQSTKTAPRKRRGIRVSPELLASVQAPPLVASLPDPVPCPVPDSASGPRRQLAVWPRRLEISLSDLRLDDQVQQRAGGVAAALVDEYAEDVALWLADAPVVVFYEPAATPSVRCSILLLDRYWLADGFHRVAAAKKAGVQVVPCVVREGGRRDAILYAVGANAAHGARRTHADKRKAIGTLLADPEWSQWSDRVIAERVGVHHTTVATVRESNTKSCDVANLATSRRNVSGSNTKSCGVGESSTLRQNVSADDPAPAVTALPAARRGRDGKLYAVPASPPPGLADALDSPPVGGYSVAELALAAACRTLAARIESAMQEGESVAAVVGHIQDLSVRAGRLVSALRDRASGG
jgi:hypothetical protein